jgi:hypothetical protein
LPWLFAGFANSTQNNPTSGGEISFNLEDLDLEVERVVEQQFLQLLIDHPPGVAVVIG